MRLRRAPEFRLLCGSGLHFHSVNNWTCVGSEGQELYINWIATAALPYPSHARKG